MHVSQEKLSVLALKYSKHKIPVDGIEVKFGAKVNSGQVIQSIKQTTKIKPGKLEEIKTIKPRRLEDLIIGKLED